MTIKYGSIDEQQPRKRLKSLIDHSTDEMTDARLTPEALERRLARLAYQDRAPSVARSAAAELLERKAPRIKNPEQALSANDARRLTDIYERLFVEATA